VKLEKPAASDQLLTSRHQYAFGPFRLNGETRELRRGHDAVPLTRKAFDTLYVLVALNNRVAEKDELLRLVWPDTIVGDDTLTQNIATIRKALGDNSDQPEYIVTVPRHGYRFVAPVQVLTSAPKAPGGVNPKAVQPLNRIGQRAFVIAFAGVSVLIGFALGWSVSRGRETSPSTSLTRLC